MIQPDQKGALPSAPGAPERRIAVSFRKSYARRMREGFMDRYLSGAHILDVGFRGGDPDAVPITETAIGVELDYPGYDGIHLPFPDESQDAVLAAHVLEHVPNWRAVLADWHRVLRIGGYLVIMVPHRHLFERRPDLPSVWNGDHKRFFTPASLLAEIEAALPVNGYRVRHLVDNDISFRYQDPPSAPPAGNFEIELVIQRIARPDWADRLHYSPEVQRLVDCMDALIYAAVAAGLRDPEHGSAMLPGLVPTTLYVPPYHRLRQRFVFDGAPELDGVCVDDAALRAAIRPLLSAFRVDEAFYRATYPDLKRAQEAGKLHDLATHWRNNGYFDGRLGAPLGLE